MNVQITRALAVDLGAVMGLSPVSRCDRVVMEPSDSGVSTCRMMSRELEVAPDWDRGDSGYRKGGVLESDVL